MAVYVDSAFLPMMYKGRKMLMSHMVADTEEELHAMAFAIGLRREWFQGASQSGIPHYDVNKNKRQEAIERGAKEVTSRELVTIARRSKP